MVHEALYTPVHGASLIQQTSLFGNMKPSKIQLNKGQPIEILRSKKTPEDFLMSRTQIEKIIYFFQTLYT